jgi:hypothetical protein
MKLKKITSALTLAALVATFLGSNSVPSARADGTNDVSASNAKPTPYPLTTCVVSGEKLGGDMGEPITFIYQTNGINQEVKFCCSMCKPKFVKNPDKYMKIINRAEAKK